MYLHRRRSALLKHVLLAIVYVDGIQNIETVLIETQIPYLRRCITLPYYISSCFFLKYDIFAVSHAYLLYSYIAFASIHIFMYLLYLYSKYSFIATK